MNEMQQASPVYPIAEDPTGLVASGATMMQTRSSFSTAVTVQKPRKLQDVERRLLDEARIAGEDFFYGWGAGKDRIEGPSKELAFAAARCYGNCAVDALPVQETDSSWIFTAAFIDLETGFTMTRQFRQSKKWTVYGKMDGERKDDIRFAIGQSKAARNVILNSLPATLINRAMTEAKAGVRTKLEEFIKANGLPAAVDLVLRALAKYGVKEEHVCSKIGVAERKALTIENLIILRGDLAQLDAGQERADALFPAMTPQQEASQQAASSTDAKMEQLKQQINAMAATQKETVEAAKQSQEKAPPPNQPASPPAKKKASKKQVDEINALVKNLGWNAADLKGVLLEWGTDDPAALSLEQADEVVATLKKQRQPGDEDE